MAFAYLDHGQVLHVIDDVEEAHKEASSDVVVTDIEHSGGYPVVDGNEVVYYEDTAGSYINGNRQGGTSIVTPQVILDLVRKIQGLE